MSAPPFDMNVWNDQQVAPELELEDFDSADPHAYAMGPNGMNVSPAGRRQDLPPSGHGASYNTFNPAFQPGNQQTFTFSTQPPQAHGLHTNQQGFFPTAGPSTLPQHPRQQQAFTPQNTMFPGPSDLTSSPNMTASGYQDSSLFGGYTASPSSSNFDVNAGQQAPYGSPPVGYAQSFQAHGLPGSHHTPFFQSNIGETYRPDLKRPREDDAGFYDESLAEDKEGAQGKVDPANKKPACTRCKQLKVKCEPSVEDAEICKRCYRGGSECTIPGRKKRRPPPKREILLNQIREQADSIKSLMAQLEEANRKIKQVQSQASNAPSPSAATDFSFVSIDGRLMSPDIESEAESPAATRTKADVQDWIAKARESMQAFDDYITMGGANVARSDLVAEDEGSDPGELDEGADGDEFAVNVEDADAENSGTGEEDAEGPAHHPRRLSSTSENQARPKKERLAIIPNAEAPFGLMARMTLQSSRPLRKMRSKSSVGMDDEEEDMGLANPDFFRRSIGPEKPISSTEGPHILRSGLITIAEAEKLIRIYWDYMNLSVSLLDPIIYTPQYLAVHSPFLFTVICGIASRFYTERPELYQKAIHYARLAAGTALIGGQKSVDVVHAYILLALYPVPSRKWEDDRSWIYLGVAIRIAMDLNLHHPNTAKPRNEMHARVMLNRTRAWLNCFNLDRSTGSQYGKGPIISNTDYVANRSEDWWNSSDYNMRGFDIHLACYNADLTIMGRFRGRIYSDPKSPTGFNKNLDIADLASKTDDELTSTWSTWIARIRQHTDPNDRQCKFRTGLLRLAYSYARMTVLSFGFQYAFGKSNLGRDVDLLNRCKRAAMDVIAAMIEDIATPDQKVYLKHGPEAQSVFVTFASAFLMNLLQPRYASYLDQKQRAEIRDKVQQVIDLLGSPEVAIDDHHSPKLYSRFLQGLLDKSISRQKKPPIKSKSESPTAPKVELKDSTGLTVRQSMSSPPSARNSMSPEPGALLDSYTSSTTAEPGDLLAAMDVNSEFFAPPLPFNDLLPSMADSSMMGVPGFAWMSNQQSDFQLGFYTNMASA